MTSWKFPSNGSWTDPLAWDTGLVPGISDTVTIGLSGGYRVSLTASIAAAALTIGNRDAALVVTTPGGAASFSGDLTNTGFLGVDSDRFTAEGGSAVTIAGILNNTGAVEIGQATGGPTAPSLLSAGGLTGSGTVTLHGGTGATPPLAEMDVLSAAGGTLTGGIALDGNALLR